ncbi:malonyl-CoA decarboxylase [Marinomonas colpomeniae]|uniref:Malonyl-CoA decarboxylase n=1 Tax=Marinomonas colpomeniae TaxID=2774408 RepID=A0ABR8P050_9GAMM|nr:malonyl-CoA decarboxylase [Marinomonas colpomeniae]MBD5771665.1 malonyl-CoA decarboxylase [Marinomonas colpomeniae]
MSRWTNIIEDLLSRVSDIGNTILVNSNTDSEKLCLSQKCLALLSNVGEATGLARSRDILEDYKKLDKSEQLAFFQQVYTDFGVDEALLRKTVNEWLLHPKKIEARQIHSLSEPRSQELIRRLNLAYGGTASLVKMREDLLQHTKEDPSLLALDKDFQHLFTSWFNNGFLRLERINWSTPATILEKVIAYEAVHEIQGWDELRLRVAANDRRLYAFFHPSLSDEPLIFVEVALTNDMPDQISSILAGDRESLDPHFATTAVFYSISNCQTGLRGISFGNFLIKQVVEELKRELPNLKRFVTMSPVPGLRRWIDSKPTLNKNMQSLVNELTPLTSKPDNAFIEKNHHSLYQLVSYYLLEAKNKKGGPFDPVSKFHLGNGARLEQINLWADNSKRGFSGSWGIMVNYEYDLNSIEINHEHFLREGIISTSPTIKRLNKNS